MYMPKTVHFISGIKWGLEFEDLQLCGMLTHEVGSDNSTVDSYLSCTTSDPASRVRRQQGLVWQQAPMSTVDKYTGSHLHRQWLKAKLRKQTLTRLSAGWPKCVSLRVLSFTIRIVLYPLICTVNIPIAVYKTYVNSLSYFPCYTTLVLLVRIRDIRCVANSFYSWLRSLLPLVRMLDLLGITESFDPSRHVLLYLTSPKTQFC